MSGGVFPAGVPESVRTFLAASDGYQDALWAAIRAVDDCANATDLLFTAAAIGAVDAATEAGPLPLRELYIARRDYVRAEAGL
ncbi:MAG: hypothetical protein QM597_06830 [Aeromicrobium sp.]|uniref:hypothetical protein n=1 Tax=Aeromicrobium sp. TaxID=1871063 RepID=UPI0039E2C274